MKKLHKYEYVIIVLLLGFIAICTKTKPDTKTIENLKVSLLSEYYTSARYNAFSEKATNEGYFQIAKLFKALSTAESIHARNFKRVLDQSGIKIEKKEPGYLVESTEKNLQKSIEEEIMDIDSIYPTFIEQSINSDISQANDVFTFVWQAEKTHKNLLMLIYDLLMTTEIKINEVAVSSAPSRENLSKIENLFSKTDYYVCPIDGKVFDNTDITDKCSLCNTSQMNFILIK